MDCCRVAYASRLEGGGMRRFRNFVIIAIAFAATRTHAAQPLHIGAPFNTAPAIGQAVAFDGTNYLLAWSAGGGIWAARVSQAGSLLDPASLLVASAAAEGAYHVAVAFSGDVYLVAWVTRKWVERSPPELDGYDTFFHFARIDRQGNVLDPGGVLITNTHPCLDSSCEWWSASVAVGQDGSNFLVSGGNYTYGTPLAHDFAAQIAPTGEMLNLVFSDWRFRQRDQSIGFDGSNYFVVAWDMVSPSGITGTRLAKDGTILDPGVFRLFDAPASVYLGGVAGEFLPRTSLAFNGDVFLISWAAALPGSPTAPKAVQASRVSRTGEVIGPPLLLAAPDGSAPAPIATVFDGCNFVTAWNDRAVRIAGDGAQLDQAPWTLLGPVTAMESDGAGTVLVMSDGSGQLIRTCDLDAPAVFVPSGLSQTATSSRGAVVEFSATAQDDVSGTLPVNCSPSSGSLFPPDRTRVTCAAMDEAGNVGSASFEVSVTFDWSGVLPPVNVDGQSIFKLGRTVPFKFQLIGASTAIPDLVARLFVSKISDGVMGTEVEAISTAAADAGNTFRFDATAGQYVFNLATSALTAGTYQARIDMGDGVERFVMFSLRR
jgi:hypothetical protein